MISEKRRDLYAGGLVFLIGSGAAIIGSKYTIGSLTKMGPGFFPAALGVVLAIMGVLAAAMEARSRVVGARMIVFKDIPGQALPHFRAAPGFVPTVSYPGTSVRLTGSSKETYLRSLSHNQRHNLLKKLKRSSALLPLETTVITQPSDAQLTAAP